MRERDREREKFELEELWPRYIQDNSWLSFSEQEEINKARVEWQTAKINRDAFVWSYTTPMEYEYASYARLELGISVMNSRCHLFSVAEKVYQKRRIERRP